MESKNKTIMEKIVKDWFYFYKEINLLCFTYTQIFIRIKIFDFMTNFFMDTLWINIIKWTNTYGR